MSRVPRLLSGPNVTSLELPPPEAYLLSRIDGVLSEEDLAFVTGMAQGEAAAAIDRLIQLGAVELGNGTLPPPRTEPPRSAGPASVASRHVFVHTFEGPTPYDPSELEESVELEPDRRRRILDLYYRLDELTYYELLGIGSDSDKKHVKSAYYALAPDYHPDKYFRKELGSYKAKIEAIFARITLAHDVLTAQQRRVEYDEYLVQTHKNRTTSAVLDQSKQDVAAILAAVEQAAAQAVAAQVAQVAQRAAQPAAPQPPSQRATPALSPEEVLRQRRETLARKLKGGAWRAPAVAPARSADPVLSPEMDAVFAERTAEALRLRHDAALAEAKAAQVDTHLEAGRAALESEDYAGAANAYRIAASLAPEDAAVQAKCNEALQRIAAALAEGYWKQAVYEEAQQRWGEAALSYSKVCAGQPENAHAHERVAYTTLKSSTNIRRAVEFARRSIELDPKKPEYRVTLARTYASAGLEKSAQSELDRALDLAPKDPRIQALVAAVRTSFTGKDGGHPVAKASGFHDLVTAMRTAIAPKEDK